ncbi:MAG: type II toxin-antitoxin system prevent-host-death family antitoxin [Gemmatimonadetes bacterium]|nr:type II toxin-antitoxin system prevent-host-death family antitoxin [Gemmatimonadota bacterium]
MQVDLRHAKSQLSKLVELVAQGEEVVICKSGRPCVRLVPYQLDQDKRKLGAWKGKVWMAPDFDDDLEIIELFEGSSVFPNTDE